MPVVELSARDRHARAGTGDHVREGRNGSTSPGGEEGGVMAEPEPKTAQPRYTAWIKNGDTWVEGETLADYGAFVLYMGQWDPADKVRVVQHVTVVDQGGT